MEQNEFGPRNEQEKIIFAQEGFRIHLQYQLYKLMRKNNWDYNEFAKRMDMDESTIHQIFESDFYVDIYVLAKMFYILGAKPTVVCEEIYNG